MKNHEINTLSNFFTQYFNQFLTNGIIHNTSYSMYNYYPYKSIGDVGKFAIYIKPDSSRVYIMNNISFTIHKFMYVYTYIYI